MTETEFRALWEAEKPVYQAWGAFVADSVKSALKSKNKDLDSFLKIPAKCRLKDDTSLIDKAFYRPEKKYEDPFNEIEDKVGVRFVVLLLNDIKEICDLIENSPMWTFDACKHFDKDKETSPLLFTYQSVHYILRPRNDIQTDSVLVPSTTPCEVQIRTLLQHAHAELTHDAIYKAKRTVKPGVHRTVAKSMALIETTDDFFASVTAQLNYGPLEEFGILDKLDNIYFTNTGMHSHTQKSSLLIWDKFEQCVNGQLVKNIQKFLDTDSHIFKIVKDNPASNILYSQSTLLFVYWMLKKKKARLLSDWPLSRKILESLAHDAGISIPVE
ncbi:GTP pyrophosphokinase [Undibacterium umbellatum]|uniref:(P)ppGpp synthetase n=1 Tax=Undibacterium umbellatum TaxID=2762300 RepID=A0ABR6ZIN3_9BURK|nr:(p)ppGpp synthetase [Undibacterium umbellatum]MBC3911583.1 (p)ppGpp synthetase [Undibacterium umbellatum]